MQDEVIDTGYKPKVTLAKNKRCIIVDGDQYVAIESPKDVDPCTLCELSNIEVINGEMEVYCSASYIAGWDENDMSLCSMGTDNDGVPYYFLWKNNVEEVNKLRIDETHLAKECHEFCMFHQEGCYNGPNCLLKILEKYSEE